MVYSYKTHIRFSEVDPDLNITLPAILTEFQDCSLFHSNAVGLGVRELTDSGHIWVLSSWQIVIDRYPSLYEEVTVSTWAYGWRNFFGFRNFTMTDADGSIAAWANTNWIYTDLATGHPVKIPTEVSDAYCVEPPLNVKFAPRKIEIPPDSVPMEPIPLRKSDIDSNLHVNNERYVLIAQEFLPDGFVTHELRAEYKDAARYGDVLYPSVSASDGIVTVMLNNAEGNPYAIVEFSEK